MREVDQEGYVRRKRPRAAAYHRYYDRDALIDWIEERAVFTGMHSIDGTKHGEGVREVWYINGQMVPLEQGKYVVIEDGHVRTYTAIDMAEYFDVTQEQE